MAVVNLNNYREKSFFDTFKDCNILRLHSWTGLTQYTVDLTSEQFFVTIYNDRWEVQSVSEIDITEVPRPHLNTFKNLGKI